MRKPNVVSLFDGISCGRVALGRAGIIPGRYYASEIERYAMTVARKNYPDNIDVGDVRYIEPLMFDGKTDILMGGSPCQSFSFAGKLEGMAVSGKNFLQDITDLDTYLAAKDKGLTFAGESYLFWEYVRLLRELKPSYFLLENVKMQKKWQDVITETLGVEPLFINSSLFSAQNRERLYWTNIPVSGTLPDYNINLDSVLLSEHETQDFRNVGEALTVKRALPYLQEKYGYIPEKFNAYNRREILNKAPTLSSGSMVTSSCAVSIFMRRSDGPYRVDNKQLFIDDGIYDTFLPDGNYFIRQLSPVECERLQTLPDNYTAGVSDNRRYKLIGNGWTADVIAWILGFLKGADYDK